MLKASPSILDKMQTLTSITKVFAPTKNLIETAQVNDKKLPDCTLETSKNMTSKIVLNSSERRWWLKPINHWTRCYFSLILTANLKRTMSPLSYRENNVTNKVNNLKAIMLIALGNYALGCRFE